MKPCDAKTKLIELLKEIQNEGVYVRANIGRIYLTSEDGDEYIALEKIPFTCTLLQEVGVGDTIYWVMADGKIDEESVTHVEYSPVSSYDHPIQFRFKNGGKGSAEIDAYGRYIFKDRKLAEAAAKKCAEEYAKLSRFADDDD